MKQKASLLAFLVLTASTQLHAANVTLSTSNTAGNTSFTSNFGWSDATAPSAVNDYSVIDAKTLRTAADSGSATFAGNSLTLGNGTTTGVLIFKNQAAGAVVTVNNLILNNGEIQNGGTSSGAGSTVTLAGGVTLTNGSSNRVNTGTAGREIIVSAGITGGGSLTVSGGGNAFFQGTNNFTGTTTLSGTGTRAQYATVGSMSSSSAITVGTGTSLGINAGGAGEFTGANIG
ncbi:MAG: hypothetical protein EOP87_13755, partial [Verrucomicrobiaceae bacterium]